MNAGLSNLATLKSWLLPASLLAVTDYDARITALGLAVGGAIEKACNRKFAWMTGDVFQCNADRTSIVLPRFPFSTANNGVTALAIRTDMIAGFVDQGNPMNLILDIGWESGLVDFGVWQGPLHARLQFTYDGGYFWEQLEPADMGYPTTQPAGSTALPTTLLGAFRLQVAEEWKRADKTGLEITRDPEKQHTVRGLDEDPLLPLVTRMIAPYVRYAMT